MGEDCRRRILGGRAGSVEEIAWQKQKPVRRIASWVAALCLAVAEDICYRSNGMVFGVEAAFQATLH